MIAIDGINAMIQVVKDYPPGVGSDRERTRAAALIALGLVAIAYAVAMLRRPEVV